MCGMTPSMAVVSTPWDLDSSLGDSVSLTSSQPASLPSPSPSSTSTASQQVNMP